MRFHGTRTGSLRVIDMTTHTHTLIRFGLLSALTFAAAALCAPATAGAQQIPWVGLAAPGAQLHGEIGQYPHSPGGADHFGFAVAAGDFNGDGFDDLASGIPGNDCDVVTWDCGSVQVRFGWSEAPLGAALTLDPAHPDAPEPASQFDEYGSALAVGDFDDDGYEDLAVGIPGDWGVNGSGPGQFGAVQVHYGLDGSLGSIQAAAEHAFMQPATDPVSFLYDDERFGHTLAVGDFNGDGHDDLAIGAPGNRVLLVGGGFITAGSVHIAHGHAGGLVPFDGFPMALGLDALPDAPEDGEQFGYALAAGDFNGDGFDDLAIGVPSEDDVGAVLVVYGSPVSLIFADHQYFGSFALGGEVQPGMRFGAALAAGDFDGDGRDDLAIGAPTFDGQGQPQPVDMGLVAVVYGPVLDPPRVHWLYEHALYGPGNGEPGDLFGAALVAGDFTGDGVDDLALGTPGEDLEISANANTGAVSVVPGRRFEGLTGAPRQLRPIGFSPNFPNEDPSGLIPDYRTGAPYYGQALAAGDFDGNGFADLAIGAPSRTQLNPNAPEAGAVAIVYGRLFADGFETGSVAAWSSAAP